MSLFARRVPFLESIFPSSGRGVPQPNEVTDVVHLVHPWPGRTLSLAETPTFIQETGAAALTPALLFLQPSGGEIWDEVLYMDISHDSATVRTLQLGVRNNLGQTAMIGRWSNMPSALTAGLGGFVPVFGSPSVAAPAAATVWVSPPRPIVIPSNMQLVVFGDTAPAAYSITGSAHIVFHSMHDVPLMY